MSFEDDFLEMMIDEITWEKATGTDEYGNATYAAPVKIQCRVSTKPTRVLTPSGDEIVSKATIYTAGDFDIEPDDRITQANGEADPVLRVSRPPDLDGKHHVGITI